MMNESPAGLNLVELVSSLGMSGLCVYVFVVYLPKLIDGFRAELASERAARELAVERFIDGLQAEREAFDRSLDKVTNAMHQQMKEHRDTVREVVARFTATLPPPQDGDAR